MSEEEMGHIVSFLEQGFIHPRRYAAVHDLYYILREILNESRRSNGQQPVGPGPLVSPERAVELPEERVITAHDLYELLMRKGVL